MTSNFHSNAEQQAEKAESLSFCRGIKLLHIRKCIEELLSFIGRSGLFEEYTFHDITHIDEMLSIVDWLIPANTKEKMTHAEWLMLTLSIYFHDLGMVVTRKEYSNRLKSNFVEYREKILTSTDPVSYDILSSDDHFLYQEFVRENHAKRIYNWIEGNFDIEYGDSEDIFAPIQLILGNLDKKFKKDLAIICESHHEDDIQDFEKYKTKILYGNDANEKVNLNYIAIILRTSDLLHITRDRSPSLSMKMINVTNPKSVLEWKKQMAVRAVAPKERRNEEGIIDESLEKDTIEVTAYFEGADTAEAYFGLSSYLKYTQSELAKCSSIVAKAKKTEGTCYDFPWQKIDETNIETVGFETKKLQFTLAQESILRLLVGHTLYNDSSVVVRELVQNAIDAVKLQNAIELKHRKTETEGKILVGWNSTTRELSFSDNGTGMTIYDIENFLLKVGASKYRDDSLRKDYPNFSSISNFGIGILTCFMIADEIDITTSSVEQNEATIINLRNLNGNYLLRKIQKSETDNFIRKHGTIVNLHVRNDVNMDNLHDDLMKWIVLPSIPVFLVKNNEPELQIGHKYICDVLTNYLEKTGIIVDNESYAVCEYTVGSVSVAIATKYNKYLSEWSIMTLSDLLKPSSESRLLLPIGTCIEGIRVEFTSPGYTTPTILAVANVTNSKYKTNVARSAIELDANNEFLSDIYCAYTNYLQTQMDHLHNMNYSESWAIKECQYLMQPLLHNRLDRSHVNAVNPELLVKNLAKLNCFIAENKGQRSSLSAETVLQLDEINIFDCQMIEAVQFLFREVSSTSTLVNVINAVCTEDNFIEGVNNVVCNFDNYNVLHQYALSNKEVSSIVVNRNRRRIHLRFNQKSNRWKKIVPTNRIENNAIFLPTDQFVIEGLDEEVGVKTIGGIYLSSNSELCKYLINKLAILSELKNGTVMTEVLFYYIFNTNILENIYQNTTADEIIKQFPNTDNEITTELWEVLDPDEFSKIILSKKHTLFSIHNWIRKEKDGYILH